MVSVRFSCTQTGRDDLIAELYDLSTTGLVEDDHGIEAFFETAEEAGEAMTRFAEHQPRLAVHGGRDYVQEFRAAWQPLALGTRLWLAPPWDSSPPPEGRIRIDYRPGMSCGSGAHVCTQLCLEALERELRPGDSFLDVGAGSGILLIAAQKLGASQRAGCDIDHDAVICGALAADPDAGLFTGSARSVRSKSFDVVAANISAPATGILLPDLRRIARRTVIVSGFRQSEANPAWAGQAVQRDGWACLTLRV